MPNSVLIYQDYVHNNGALYNALTGHYGPGAVGYCDAAAIISGILDPTIKLLVMPGGADLYYCEKLNGVGNRAIRNFVENGGSYLGICAGAYYACDAITWAKDSDLEITGPRELKFYGGMATGPIPYFMQTLDQPWLRAASITDAKGPVTVCYEAGPVFTEPANKSESVIARYTDLPGQPPAIVEARIGKGLAILSSPHIERLMPAAWSELYSVNNPHYDHMHKVYKALSKDHVKQAALWSSILNSLVTQKRKQVYAA